MATTARDVFDYDPETGVFIRKRFRRAEKSLSYKGYVVIFFDGKKRQAHRLAWLWMTGEWPKDQIDHINGDRADNRWANLREATNAQNQRNAKVKKTSRSGLRGVHYKLDHRAWLASITRDRKRHHLGYFATPEEAYAAYCAAAHQFHGDFARP